MGTNHICFTWRPSTAKDIQMTGGSRRTSVSITTCTRTNYFVFACGYHIQNWFPIDKSMISCSKHRSKHSLENYCQGASEVTYLSEPSRKALANSGALVWS